MKQRLFIFDTCMKIMINLDIVIQIKRFTKKSEFVSTIEKNQWIEGSPEWFLTNTMV